MKFHFEAHQSPNQSRLEPWENEITEMRSLSWPYQRIAEWFRSEQNISISETGVRKFCVVRGIQKGQTEEPLAPKRSAPKTKTAKPQNKPLFEYDSEKAEPINIHR